MAWCVLWQGNVSCTLLALSHVSWVVISYPKMAFSIQKSMENFSHEEVMWKDWLTSREEWHYEGWWTSLPLPFPQMSTYMPDVGNSPWSSSLLAKLKPSILRGTGNCLSICLETTFCRQMISRTASQHSSAVWAATVQIRKVVTALAVSV